jgi:O-acetylhomoserine (thiol)-lyase
LFRNLKSYGIKTNFLETLDEESLEKVVTEKTKVLFAEAIGNPKLDILDIEKVSEFCNKHNIIFIVDSTITTPYLINPIKYGADVVIHSTSKYINGTSNSIGGVIVDGGSTKYKNEKFENFSNYSKKFGKMAFTGKLRDTIGKDLGAALSPMSAFLNLTGIETLSLRMKQHCENTLKVAEYLEAHEKVVSVNYPKLKSSPYYNLAEKYYEKGASGILTFRLGSKDRCFKFINELKLIVNLTNVGDTKTLIIHPASTICLSNTEEEKLQMGVYEDLIRLSVGIEDIEDIIGDIEEALKAI